MRPGWKYSCTHINLSFLLFSRVLEASLITRPMMQRARMAARGVYHNVPLRFACQTDKQACRFFSTNESRRRVGGHAYLVQGLLFSSTGEAAGRGARRVPVHPRCRRRVPPTRLGSAAGQGAAEQRKIDLEAEPATTSTPCRYRGTCQGREKAAMAASDLLI